MNQRIKKQRKLSESETQQRALSGSSHRSWLDGDLRGLDPGVSDIVARLQAEGLETFESCQGGEGHAFPEPTVRFHGTAEAGWRALGICLAFGLPVLELRRVWHVLDRNEPTGPYWEVTFRAAKAFPWHTAGDPALRAARIPYRAAFPRSRVSGARV